jgi:hypothetical protein
LKLKCDEPLSNFVFNFNVRRYNEGSRRGWFNWWLHARTYEEVPGYHGAGYVQGHLVLKANISHGVAKDWKEQAVENSISISAAECKDLLKLAREAPAWARSNALWPLLTGNSLLAKLSTGGDDALMTSSQGLREIFARVSRGPRESSAGAMGSVSPGPQLFLTDSEGEMSTSQDTDKVCQVGRCRLTVSNPVL